MEFDDPNKLSIQEKPGQNEIPAVEDRALSPIEYCWS
jgi:hypothetical protein